MRIQVLGFSQQSVVTVDEVLQTFQVPPEAHRRGIHLIRYDPKREVASAINQYLEPSITLQTQGTFYQSDSLTAIVLWEFRNVTEFRHILFHEVGHHVFAKVLPQDMRDQWFYEIRPLEGTTVSKYACKNAKEDFAECYATWLTRIDLLQKCPQRFKYFRKIFASPGAEEIGEGAF